jgi:hypothetical protein
VYTAGAAAEVRRVGVARGVFVKDYDRVATVRLREIFLSTARPGAGCTRRR